MKYTISYDLHRPGQAYPQLWEALKAMGATRILESQWVIYRTGTTSVQIRDYLRQYIDANDRLFVVNMDSGGDWAGWNLRIDPNLLKSA